MIWLSPPELTGLEQESINQVIESKWLAPNGPAVTTFEAQLALLFSLDEVIAVNSGTAALHLALIALGISHGDEVLCPTNTFAGSIFPVIYTGAKPILVEASPESWTISLDWLQEALASRRKAGATVKAVIAVDLYGMPCNYAELLQFCRTNELLLIIDAAESLGSTYQQKHTIGLADAGIVSFNGNKIITTSGGGALYLANPQYRTTARRIANQAKQPARYYLHQEIGYNYNLSSLSAAIGLAQLPELSWRVQQKRKIFENYQHLLTGKIPFRFQQELDPATSNRWLSVFYFPDISFNSIEIIQNFANKQIELRTAWNPMHTQPIFQETLYFGDGFSTKLFQNGLCLPSGIKLTENQQEKIIDMLIRLLVS